MPVRHRKTRKDLAFFAKQKGLEPIDIAKALEERDLEFSSDPEVWGQLESAIEDYAERNKKEEEE